MKTSFLLILLHRKIRIKANIFFLLLSLRHIIEPFNKVSPFWRLIDGCSLPACFRSSITLCLILFSSNITTWKCPGRSSTADADGPPLFDRWMMDHFRCLWIPGVCFFQFFRLANCRVAAFFKNGSQCF